MYLKTLKIEKGNGDLIRLIKFHMGLNLIVDITPSGLNSGNGVGKTTVIKLIDFCLGGDPKEIYIDPEKRRRSYVKVKEFLMNQQVLVTLTLKENLFETDSKEVIIERSFLERNKKILRINGIQYLSKDFENALADTIFPDFIHGKPTFRQVIAHNIRYKDESINNTLKHLDKYSKDSEYETLYLFLFGCDFSQGARKQQLLADLKIEEKFKNQLENGNSRLAYISALQLVEEKITELEELRKELDLSPDFKGQLDLLNETKYRINFITSELSLLEMRKQIIQESIKELQPEIVDIDADELKQLYKQAKHNMDDIQKTFTDLLGFHNKMIQSRINFISEEIPQLEGMIYGKNSELNNLVVEKNHLVQNVHQTNTAEELEGIIQKLNEYYTQKGRMENIIDQLGDTEERIKIQNDQLSEIDNGLFSTQFGEKVQLQINKFNKFFSQISAEIYGEEERYAIKADPVSNNGKTLYQFDTFNAWNFSSGKKQGEISCFDIAYILFARAENINHLEFLLNDKKELLHGNQLEKLAQIAEKNNFQFVLPILYDKLPLSLKTEKNTTLELSQTNRLFGIENE